MKYSKISRLFLAWLTLFVLMGSFLPWRGLVPSAQAATLDPAQWAHMRPITIDNTGNANALTDYQVKIDIDFDPDMNSDFSDLRFTDSDGTSELNYWIEKYTASTSATVWAKVPSVPASSNKIIYMYYGNASAESISDGDNTFDFFDDFKGTILDASKWTEDAVNDIDHTVNNYFRYEDATKSSNSYWIYNNSDTGSQHQAQWTPTSSFIAEWYSKISDTAASQMGQGCVALVGSDNKISAIIGHGDGSGVDLSPLKYYPAFVEGSSHGSTAVSSGDEGNYKIVRNANSVKLYDDETLLVDGTSADITKLALAASGYEGYPFLDYVEIQNLKVRKYTSPEPTIAINEENYPPSTPVHLYTNDSINPTDITSSSLTLSAEYDDADTSDTASFYEIQVIADGGSWASPYWDSAKSACLVDEGDRLAITYSGSALDLNYQKYYQRWKFWDDAGIEGDWSDGTDYFITAVPKDEYGANVGGYAWSDNIGWLSFNNNDTTSFVASYNAGTGQLEGWGWSDGIGWVSLNCATDEQCNPATEDHKVIIDVSGDLSGEAWSDNLGWLSFDRSDTGNPPGEPYQASGAIAHYDSSAMEFSGWARFLTAPEGGWDGWIKLRCYGAECSESGWSDGKGATSGVFIDDGGYLQGWAWGSDVVGWLGFKGPGSVDYGVDIDEENNKLSGHVWSENLGWISFDRDETGTPPSDDPCVDESCLARLKSDNYQLDGWMRALNYGDGWDGWISLNKKTGDSFDYEVVFNPNSKEFEGWAYGSDVLGWISFNHLTDGSSVDYMVYSGLPMGIQPTDPHDTWDLCADSLHPTLNWSVAGDINGYEVEIYSDADLNNLVYLYQADMASTSHHAGYDASNIDDTEGTCHLSGNGFQNEPDCNLHYGGTSYWWRVRVRNLDDVWGEWSTIDDFTVVSNHHWPIPSFSTNPENPQTGSVTHFLDETAVYGGATAVSWQWLFSGGLGTDYEYANETSSVSQNPDITFLNNNSETVGLETTDSDDYGPCSCSGLVDITSGSIQWQEVSPTP